MTEVFKKLKIGFIGGGALTEAVVKGIAEKFIESKNIFVSDHKQKRCDEFSQRYKINAAVGVDSFIDEVDSLIIAVKPKDAITAINEVKEKVKSNAIIISVVAGLKIKNIEENFKTQTVVRVMPNVAISVGEGMSAYSIGRVNNSDDLKFVSNLWSALGRSVEVDEKMMDAVTGLSGSGSAYAFLMIDALSDGAVAAGLPRAKAIELAAQTLLGAAKMILISGEHPDVLRDKVTSPAGTTIEGLRILEKCGVRSALIEAVLAATDKSKSL